MSTITSRSLSSPQEMRSLRGRILIYVTCIIIIGIITALIVIGFPKKNSDDYGPKLISLVISVILAAIPILICLVQTITKSRQIDKLMSLDGQPSANTCYFKAAKISISSIDSATLSSDYIVPLLAFFIVTLLGFLMLLMGPFDLTELSKNPSFILSGMNIVSDSSEYLSKNYQIGTFVVVCMAFIGAYVYVLGKLLDRLNNNDLYPISFYYYTVHIVVACLVAAVFRHLVDAITLEVLKDPQFLVLLGFVTGLTPELFIFAMARKTFQSIKVFGSKDSPDENTRPKALPLLMLSLTKYKVDRLYELGIDSSQVLSCQNPFLIWPRLPYDLGLVVDWIAEAQLYALVKEIGLRELRKKYVIDIFDLHTRLADPTARDEVCRALELDVRAASSLVRQLDEDQSFNRLKEVRDALASRAQRPTSCACLVDNPGWPAN